MSESTLINDILSYLMIGTGTIFSLLTVILVLANWHMLRNVYAQLMLAVQLSHLLACLIATPYYPDLSDRFCKVGGALFYFFWLISNFLVELMLLRVYLDLRNYHIGRYRWFFRILMVLSVAVAGVLSFVPMETYQECTINDYQLYCGFCPDGLSSIMEVLGWLIKILPAAIGLLLLILMVVRVHKVNRQGADHLTVRQKQAMNVLFIPSTNAAFIILNFVLMTTMTRESSPWWGHVLVVLGQLIFLTPLLNHIFFVRFATKLEELSELKMERCRWMLLCWYWSYKKEAL